MEIQFAIIRAENVEHLCYKVDATYVDVSNPMLAFTVDEDEFEVVEPDCSFMEDEQDYIVLSVNLESMDALGLPDCTFIDINHYPEAMQFLTENGLANDSGYKRRSGFVEYPMATLNLPLLYRHNPQNFQKANIEIF